MLVLWPSGVLILPGCLPLLVVERRLVDYLLQWVKIFIFPDQQNAGHSNKQQGFAEEVAHLVYEPHTRQAIDKVSHEEADHGSTACMMESMPLDEKKWIWMYNPWIKYIFACLSSLNWKLCKWQELRITIQLLGFRKVEPLHPCPPWNNWSIKDNGLLCSRGLWIIFKPFPSPGLWNHTKMTSFSRLQHSLEATMSVRCRTLVKY